MLSGWSVTPAPGHTWTAKLRPTQQLQARYRGWRRDPGKRSCWAPQAEGNPANGNSQNSRTAEFVQPSSRSARHALRRFSLRIPLIWPKPTSFFRRGNLRDDLLHGEIFYTLEEAKVLVEEPKS